MRSQASALFRSLALAISLLPLAALLGCACGHGQGAADPTAKPPAKNRLALALPQGAARPAPESLDALLELYQLKHAPLQRYQEALRAHIGARVQWQLLSWGGEVTSGEGFFTPAGRQRAKLDSAKVGRVRLISRTLGPKAKLGDAMDAGHPIVCCLALFGASGHFVSSKNDTPPTPRAWRPVVLEGTLWGVTQGPHIWLQDCRLVR